MSTLSHAPGPNHWVDGQNLQSSKPQRSAEINSSPSTAECSEDEVMVSSLISMGLLIEHCRLRATGPADILDRQMMIDYEIGQQNHENDVPYRSWIHKKWCLLFLLVLSACSLFSAGWTLASSDKIGLERFTSWRLKTFEAADVPLSLAFILHGCVVTNPDLILNTSIRQYTEPLKMDGFELITPDDTNMSSSLSFVLSASLDGNTWAVVGSSTFRWTSYGVRFLNQPTKRRSKMIFDHRPPWPWFVHHVWSGIVLGLALVGAAIFGMMAMPRFAMKCSMYASLVLATSYGIAAVGYLNGGHPQEAFLPGIYCCGFSVLLASLLSVKWPFAEICFAIGISLASARVASDCAVFEDCGNLLAEPPAAEALALALGSLLMLVKRGFWARAHKDITPDRRRHDAVWAWQLADGESSASVASLTACVRTLAASAGPGGARHYNRFTRASLRRREVEAGDASSWFGRCRQSAAHALATEAAEAGCYTNPIDSVAGTCDFSRPVASLDQLYSQALGVVAVLTAKAEHWAAASAATLDPAHRNTPPSHPAAGGGEGGGGGGPGRVESPHTLEHWVRRRFVKCPLRAVRKARTCYKGDCSQLVDVCRARVVFDRVGDMITCLEHILADAPVVTVRRIKDGMRAAHNPALTGGFRAVIVNLCFDTPVTRLLGVENHVCELQLQLKCFQECNDWDAHNRYLDFRMARSHMYLPSQLWHVDSPAAAAAAASDAATPGGPFTAAPAIAKLAPAGPAPSAAAPAPALGFSDSAAAVAANPPGRSTALGHKGGVGAERSARLFFSRSAESDDSLPAGLQRRLYQVYLRSTLKPGGCLDRQRFDISKALHFASDSSVWFTSNPLAAALSKPVFQAYAFIVAVFFAVQVSLGVEGFYAGNFHADALRLTPLRLRGAAHPVTAANITAFGLLRDGCIIPGSRRSYPDATNGGDEVVSVLFDKAVNANGYFFVTSELEGSAETDPTHWTVEASAEQGEWALVGASLWRFIYSGQGFFHPSCGFPVPMARGEIVRVDYRRTWLWVLGSVVGNASTAASLIASTLSGRAGRPGYSRPLLLGMFVFRVSANVVAAVGFHWAGAWREAAERWLQVPEVAWLGVGLALFPSHFAAILMGYTVLGILDKTIYVFAIFEVDWLYFINDSSLAIYAIMAAFGTLVMVSRMWVVVHAQRLVDADRRCYDELWQRIVADPDGSEGLVAVAREVALMHAALVDSICRQMNRPAPQQLSERLAQRPPRRRVGGIGGGSSSSSGGSGSGSEAFLGIGSLFPISAAPTTALSTRASSEDTGLAASPAESLRPICGEGLLDGMRNWLPRGDTSRVASALPARASRPPVDSLDQLMAQAACLESILVHKVKQWAAAAGGCFPLRPRGGGGVVGGDEKKGLRYVRFSDIAEEDHSLIKWGKLKSIPRAIEKVARSYSQDVSRLCDLCRQSIVFDTTDDVARCLRAIHSDAEARLVRVKNRLDPDYESDTSAGYRDVAVNLRLDTHHARDLGLDSHVCELQLLLRPFAELKSDEGHSRYVTFRNLKAE